MSQIDQARIRALFPQQPYPQQVQLVKDILNSTQKKTPLLLESPTGTGKSYSLMVAACLWLEQNQWNSEFYDQSKRTQVDLPEWLVSENIKLKQQSAQMQVQRKRIKIRTQALQKGVFILQEQKPQFQKCRVVIASRTHTQLAQLCNTFNSLSTKLSLVTFGSKQKLCVNSKISLGLVQSQCKALLRTEKGCPFNKCSQGNLLFLNKSVQQAKSLGSAKGICPYFGSRGLTDLSDILLVPYANLLSSRTRRMSGLQLKNCLLIFDEAHNVVSNALNLGSFQFTLAQLQMLQEKVSSFLSQKSGRMRVGSSHLLRGLMTCLAGSLKWLREETSSEAKLITVSQFLFRIKVDCYETETLQLIEEHDLDTRLSVQNLLLSQFASFINALIVSDQASYNFIFDPAGPSIKLKQLIPQELIKVFQQSRASVFLGGTLSPSFEFNVLGQPHLIKYTHVLPKENLKIIQLRSALDFKLDFRLANKQQWPLLLNTLLHSLLCQHPKGGIACFVPSYSFLDAIKPHLEPLPFKTFFQTRNQDCFSLYQKEIKEKGIAVLMAVMGGKLSEGVNFSDQLARLLIVIGQPYPNSRDPELAFRLETLYPGKQQFICEQMCYKTINQTIGRIVRHKNDYGVVALCDQRFVRQRRSLLSEWLQGRVEEGRVEEVRRQVLRQWKEQRVQC